MCPPCNTCFLRPIRVHNRNGFAQLTAVSSGIPRHVLSRKNCPLHGDLDPLLIHTCFIKPTRVYNPNGISIGSAVFAQLTSVMSSFVGHVGKCPSPKLPLSMGGSGSPSNTWFPEPQTQPQPKLHLDWLSRFCKAHSRLSSGMPGHVLSLCMAIRTPCNTRFFVPTRFSHGDQDPL